MSERKNIDRLFQEKFKDFEMAPSDAVWANIQSKMNKKEKKVTLTPFWLRLCGLTAAFLIGFSVATTFIAGPFGVKDFLIEGNIENEASVKDTAGSSAEIQQNSSRSEDSFEKKSVTTGLVTTDDNKGSDTNSVTSSNNKTVARSDRSVSLSKNGAASADVTTAQKTIALSTSVSEKNSITAIHGSSENKKANALVANNSTSKRLTTSTTHSKSATSEENTANNNSTSTVAATLDNSANSESEKSTANSTATTNSDTTENAASTGDSVAELQKNHITEEEIMNDSDLDIHFMDNNQSKVAYETGHKYVSTKNTEALNASLNAGKSKSTSTDFSDENSTQRFVTETTETKTLEKGVLAVTDSLAKPQEAVAAKAEEEKATEEKDKKDSKEKTSKWIVSSTVSPVYMNLNGEGSALDSKFAENSKSYTTSMSYGVGLKYALNDKWSIRTGVNLLNFEYSTNNLTYYYSNSSTGLEHVDENGAGTGIVIENQNPKGIVYNENGVVSKRFKGNVSHRMNYVEVPLETSYKLLNKKFGVDVIGGVSSLFLNDNRVSLVSAESNTTIGEANNLNKVHFSTNVGLGLRYNFMKTLQANVEPMFKYQINTYNGDAGNFKPYFFGVYTGVSFSF